MGRVFDLLYLSGTTPQYVLPKIDDALIRELLEAFEPLPHDPPFETASRSQVEAFLAKHRGAQVVTTGRLVGQDKPRRWWPLRRQ